ncbi:hypothetical protein E2C01_020974 [Portunus trituberculatus]|uniref:Uncharacterized protein n=1 Tax=Portunus trituberculatus TaxID=210409 RepID=A0A5B7E1J1_PORTR|nr:hypothetical protein [Portunus trituberculatus]
MEAYIPHSFSQPKPFKPWFNTACSRAIHDGELAHKRNLSLPSSKSHALYISSRNHAKSVLQLAKHFFINRKCQKLSNSNSLVTSGIRPKTSSITLLLHLSLLYFILMAPLPSLLSLKLNSSLKPMLTTPPWMILGLFLLLLLPQRTRRRIRRIRWIMW